MLSGGGDSGGGVAKWVRVLPRYGSGFGEMKIERGARCFGRELEEPGLGVRLSSLHEGELTANSSTIQ